MKATAGKPAKLPAAERSAQDWLTIADLRGGLLLRPDGALVGGVTVAPFSLALKSPAETRSIIGAVHAALNALDRPWEIVSMYRPVDLDTYLSDLDAMLGRADPRRKPALRDYLAWVTQIVHSGETVERRYFLLITRTGRDAPAEHAAHLPQFAQDLRRVRSLQCRVMTDQDWRELLFLTFQADHAVHEAVPDGRGRLPAQYVPEG
jgi:hypothetical protein